MRMLQYERLNNQTPEAELFGAADPQEVEVVLDGLRLRGRSPSKEREGVIEQEVPTEEERRWSGYVAAASGFDMASSGVVSIVGFCFAYRSNSVSLCCLGIQAVAHLCSSVLLMIRFLGESQVREAEDASGLLRAHRRRFLGREHSVNLAMGVVMFSSSVGLVYKAFNKVQHWNTWYEDHAHMDAEAQIVTEALAWYGFAAYLLQAIFRYRAADKLRRHVLWSAFSASVVALLFLLVLGISASYQKEWSWKAEPFAAIVLAMATLIEGMRMMILNFEDVEEKLKFDARA